MKTLVVVAHPGMEGSTVNKRWLEELKKYPEQITVHELYKKYPDEKLNVQWEQELIETHDQVILQFPVYWFNCPPLLKKWLDEVLLYGWAYGSGGDKLKDKKVACAVSAGITLEDYTSEGRYKYTLDEILRPFEVTFLYTEADYRPFFAFYGTEHGMSEQQVSLSAEDYVKFIHSL